MEIPSSWGCMAIGEKKMGTSGFRANSVWYKKKFFTMRVTENWDRLPKGISLLQLFKAQFDKTLNKVLTSTKGCGRWSPVVPFNLDFSMNHCSCDSFITKGYENVQNVVFLSQLNLQVKGYSILACFCVYPWSVTEAMCSTVSQAQLQLSARNFSSR